MKLALLGDGKTGSCILKLTKVNEVFNIMNPPTLANLSGFTHAISFLPGPSFEGLIDTLIAAKLNVVCGSTGFTIPSNLDSRLREANLTWCYGSNFSLGIGLLHDLIMVLKKYDQKLNPNYTIIETHHLQKKDKPSGTAISIRDWLGKDAPIESIREGDIVGIHELVIDTPEELITLSHFAKNRTMFARGALFALNNLDKIPPGLTYFTDMLGAL